MWKIRRCVETEARTRDGWGRNITAAVVGREVVTGDQLEMALATLLVKRAFPAIRPGRNKAPHVDSIVVVGESDVCQPKTSRRSPRDGQLDQPSCASLTHHDHRGALRLCSSLGANRLDAYLMPRVPTHMQVDQGAWVHKTVMIVNALSVIASCSGDICALAV